MKQSVIPFKWKDRLVRRREESEGKGPDFGVRGDEGEMGWDVTRMKTSPRVDKEGRVH